ncbi:unnamed protein product [Trichogramma brassicae]|uniref:Uncharacterized protein n=1 Tax=Trichogramma brassicae TaxID=86971 RepID=A0A6H5J2B0_9HYME|nr:unnamed protein product [Trichogramma brassicae]
MTKKHRLPCTSHRRIEISSLCIERSPFIYTLNTAGVSHDLLIRPYVIYTYPADWSCYCCSLTAVCIYICVLSSRNGPGETAHVQLLQRSKSYIVPTTSSTSNNTTGGSSMNNSTNNCNNNRNSILEGIHLSNLQDGETLSYGLALVRGRVPATCKRLRVRCLGSSSNVNNSNNGLTQQQQQQGSGGVKQTSQHQWAEWPCVNGDFRLLVELQRGHNRVELEAAGHRRKFGLVYEPRYTRLRVTPVYVICAGHDGYFQVCTATYI